MIIWEDKKLDFELDFYNPGEANGDGDGIGGGLCAGEADGSGFEIILLNKSYAMANSPVNRRKLYRGDCYIIIENLILY